MLVNVSEHKFSTISYNFTDSFGLQDNNVWQPIHQLPAPVTGNIFRFGPSPSHPWKNLRVHFPRRLSIGSTARPKGVNTVPVGLDNRQFIDRIVDICNRRIIHYNLITS